MLSVAKDPSFLHADNEDSVHAQADLSLRWAQMPFCWFRHEAAHFIFDLGHDKIYLCHMQTRRCSQPGHLRNLISVSLLYTPAASVVGQLDSSLRCCGRIPLVSSSHGSLMKLKNLLLAHLSQRLIGELLG